MADAFDFLKSLDDLNAIISDAFFLTTDFTLLEGLSGQLDILKNLDEHMQTEILAGIFVQDFDEALQVANLSSPTDAEQILSGSKNGNTCLFFSLLSFSSRLFDWSIKFFAN